MRDPRRSRWSTGLAAVLAVVACGDASDGNDRGPVEQREAVVRWEAGGFAEAGGASFADYPSGGALLADGRVAVTDPGQGAILLLGPGGEFVATLGRRGYGPGEFQRIDHVGVLGDTALWATDNRSTWITVFDLADPDSSWTISMAERQVPSTHWSVRAGWLLADGRALGQARQGGAQGARDEARTVPIATMTPGGSAEIVETVPSGSPRQRKVEMANGAPLTSAQPISASPLFGASPGGEWLWVLDRSPPSGPEGTMAFRRYAPAGDLLGESEISYESAPVGDEVIEWLRVRAQAFEDQLGRETGVTTEAVLDSTWIPDWLPPAHDALADEDGLWIHRQPWLDGWWQRFSLDGQLRFEVRLPPEFAALAASETHLLGWHADSLNVAVIRLFEIAERGR